MLVSVIFNKVNIEDLVLLAKWRSMILTKHFKGRRIDHLNNGLDTFTTHARALIYAIVIQRKAVMRGWDSSTEPY
eukprot:scaffold75720_cov67-Cyclotella_meneghiniana.AAC.3